MMDSLYFDNQSATRPFPEVMETFSRSAKEYWASPSSPHFLGQQQLYPLQKNIESLFLQLGAQDQDQIFFSSSGRQAIYQVFLTTYFQEARQNGKTLFLIPKTEDAAVLSMCQHMENLGCSFKELPVNAKGQVTPDILEEAITPRTALVSLSWASGLTGVLHPLEDLAAVCKKKGVLLHVDASHVYGKNFFRFQDLSVDFLTFDGSVMHAPKGTALTLVKAGGNSSESISGQVEPDTASIAALTKAIEMMQEKFELYCMEIVRLRDRFENGVTKACPGSQVLFKDAARLPTSSVIAFPPVSAESLLFLLNSKGVYASIGGGRYQVLADLLKGAGVSLELATSSVSFCLSHDMTEEEIDRAIALITECFAQLKKCAGGL